MRCREREKAVRVTVSTFQSKFRIALYEFVYNIENQTEREARLSRYRERDRAFRVAGKYIPRKI